MERSVESLPFSLLSDGVALSYSLISLRGSSPHHMKGVSRLHFHFYRKELSPPPALNLWVVGRYTPIPQETC